MRYITDILERYKGGTDFVTGAIAANAQGLINRGIFTAAISYNDAMYQKRKSLQQDRNYDVNIFHSPDYCFSDINLKYKDSKAKTETTLQFGLSNIRDVMDGKTRFFTPPPLLRCQRSKNISVTIIDDGNESEIVENFGINSWDIEMTGLLIDMEEHHYPQEQLIKLVLFFEINDIIDVISIFLNDLGIHSLYFKEKSIEPLEGFPDTIKFSLQAKSIKPVEFSILNGD